MVGRSGEKRRMKKGEVGKVRELEEMKVGK